MRHAGFPVVITELARLLVVRRTVAFASVVYGGAITIEGMTAHHAESVDDVRQLLIAIGSHD